MEKVGLAYSGGLDTSVIIPYLKEKHNLRVIAYTADLGQQIDPEALRKKALQTGAEKFYCEQLQDDFVRDYIFPALAANALYQGAYPLATALSRPLIASRMVRLARKERAGWLSHGCTGKGNDQVRFELTWKALAPKLQIIAPLREWDLKSREEEIEFARQRSIPIPVTRERPYSLDENLWGISIEGGRMEDPASEPPEDAYQLTVAPEKAPDKPCYLDIGFEQGIPVALQGKQKEPVTLITELNKMGGAHGVGRVDMIEDRTVGLKSREIYEAPAASILIAAHRELESLVLSAGLRELKESLAGRYARLAYGGFWFSEERAALDALFTSTQRYVTGSVRVKLFKGKITVVGRRSAHSLYAHKMATYGKGDIFDHTASRGFIELLGLPLAMEARRPKK